MYPGFQSEADMRQKSITLRLPEDEYKAFTTICSEKGYSKTGKIREFIRNMVTTEMSEVESSAGEWERVREEMRAGKSRSKPEGTGKPARGRIPGERRERPRQEAEPSDETWKL